MTGNSFVAGSYPGGSKKNSLLPGGGPILAKRGGGALNWPIVHFLIIWPKQGCYNLQLGGGTDPPLISEKKLAGFRFFVGRFGKFEKLAGFRF